jgi:DNA-binding beta-propeller fold protein YncE
MVLDQVATIPLPPHAKEGGFDHAAVDERQGRLYVAHTANDAVDVIDVEARRYVRSIAGLTAVAGALVSPTDGVVFTSNRGENTVGVFGPNGDDLTKIRVGVRPNGLAYDADRKILLAANVGHSDIAGSLTVSVVDVASRALLGDIPVPGRTRWAVFDPISRLFYVNIADPPCIVMVDAADRRVVRSLPSPVAGPHGLDLDVPRRRLFCACDGGQLLTISLESGQVEKTAPLSGVPDVVFFNANLSHVYVAIGDPGVIDVIHAADLHRVATVKTEPGAHTIGFDAARQTVYAFLPQAHSAAVYRAKA